jgi:hypothetical protein
MNNVMIGMQAGWKCNDKADHNTLIGHGTGLELVDGSYNTIIGSNSTVGPHDCGNVIVGSGCVVHGNHNVVVGDNLVVKGDGQIVVKNLSTPLVPFLQHLENTVRQIQCGDLGAAISIGCFDNIQNRLKFELLRDFLGYDLGELVYKYSILQPFFFVPSAQFNT